MANLIEIAQSTPKFIKRFVPFSVKAGIKIRLADIIRWYQGFNSELRALPSFIIVGAQKCGTTTLYDQLSQHPNIVPAIFKETYYFNINYNKGLDWYRANFPILTGKDSELSDGTARLITGESTTGYMYYPYGFERIAKTLPDVKIIIMLRNPVDRAYSSYHHQKIRGYEKYSFEEAITLEEERLAPDLERMSRDQNYYGYNFRRFSYLARGIYIDQVKRCFEHFPKERVLIIASEEFFTDNPAIYEVVLEFLDLPKIRLPEYKNIAKQNYEKMRPETRKRLVDYYLPYNTRLYELLGRKFDWDK